MGIRDRTVPDNGNHQETSGIIGNCTDDAVTVYENHTQDCRCSRTVDEEITSVEKIIYVRFMEREKDGSKEKD